MQDLNAKRLSVEAAVDLVKDGQVFVSGGFVGCAHPEALTSQLERKFLATGSPKNLTLVYAGGQGDGADRGLNHLGHAGLVKRVIGGHWNLAPKLGTLAVENKIEAYNFPLGVIASWYREASTGKDWIITRVGLGMFCDPRLEGGKLNSVTKEDLVEHMTIDGKEYLRYRIPRPDVVFLRATVADPHGNVSMRDEGMSDSNLAIAIATHNHGGTVIVQVREISDQPLPPREVTIPGVLINYIVQAPPHEHQQTFVADFNPAFVGRGGTPAERAASGVQEKLPNSERRLVGERAFRELKPGNVVNLGIGLPESVAAIAAEKGALSQFCFTVESGPIGGIPAAGLNFGMSYYPDAIIDQPYMFDFYDGGGLDICFLGAAQIDPLGNVNVSKFGPRVAGIGGFVNISQAARKVVFCLGFTAGGMRAKLDGGKVVIAPEGKERKFLKAVEQVSFSAEEARKRKQEVLYVTERCVFKLSAKAPKPGESGLELIEVALGIDKEKQILSLMDFKPRG
ncbi:MAG TPA: CoA-transferase [Planctomycetota bacterium]|nr:CoA-transferase [Planctomycetota bacterium]